MSVVTTIKTFRRPSFSGHTSFSTSTTYKVFWKEKKSRSTISKREKLENENSDASWGWGWNSMGNPVSSMYRALSLRPNTVKNKEGSMGEHVTHLPLRRPDSRPGSWDTGWGDESGYLRPSTFSQIWAHISSLFSFSTVLISENKVNRVKPSIFLFFQLNIISI